MKIEEVSIDSIKPYEGNAKLHPDEQVEQIAESIQKFGFRDPIGVWNGTIVEGHGRWLAAKKIGMDTVPVIHLDDMTDEERRAYTLVHNKLTMNTDFDFDKLQEELDLLDDIDMSDFGFEDMEESGEEPDLSESVKEEYQVIVECEGEDQQKNLYEDLIAEGYTCRLSTL